MKFSQTNVSNAVREQTNDNQNCAFQIKSILDSFGLPNMWLRQEYQCANLSQIKQRIFDQYKKSCYVALITLKYFGLTVDININLNLNPT